MMTIMLCGASDVGELWESFRNVVWGFGGHPITYSNATTKYLNVPGSDWRRNSSESVESAGLCVFVLMKEYGRITWETEMQAVLNTGRPFLLLARQRTLDNYYATRDLGVLHSALPDENTQALFNAIKTTEDHNFTIAGFEADNFGVRLREAIAETLERGITSTARLEEASRLLRHPTFGGGNIKSPENSGRLQSGNVREQVLAASEELAKAQTRSERAAELESANANLLTVVNRRKQLPLILIGVALIAGLIIGALFAGGILNATRRPGSIPTAGSTSAAGGGGASNSAAPTPTPNISHPPTRAQPTYTTHDCGTGFAVQLASVGEKPEISAGDIAVILRDNYKRQLKAAGETYTILASKGSEYCTAKKDADRQENIILWIGPFNSFDEATTTKANLESEGVCADCFPTR